MHPPNTRTDAHEDLMRSNATSSPESTQARGTVLCGREHFDHTARFDVGAALNASEVYGDLVHADEANHRRMSSHGLAIGLQDGNACPSSILS